jgi:hypothetical protein
MPEVFLSREFVATRFRNIGRPAKLATAVLDEGQMAGV